MIKNNESQSNIHRTLNLHNSVEKRIPKKIILIIYSMLDRGFILIPFTTLYDEYIDRPKLLEQKKRFEYIVGLLKWAGTIIGLEISKAYLRSL